MYPSTFGSSDFIQSSHLYEVIVYNNQDAQAPFCRPTLNGEPKQIPIGKPTRVPGSYLKIMFDTGIDQPVSEFDQQTGQMRTTGVRRLPKYSVQVLRDVTVGENLPAIPGVAAALSGSPFIPGQPAPFVNRTMTPEEAKDKLEEQGVHVIGDNEEIPREAMDDMSLNELRAIAKRRRVPNYWTLKKDDLIENLAKG